MLKDDDVMVMVIAFIMMLINYAWYDNSSPKTIQKPIAERQRQFARPSLRLQPLHCVEATRCQNVVRVITRSGRRLRKTESLT